MNHLRKLLCLSVMFGGGFPALCSAGPEAVIRNCKSCCLKQRSLKLDERETIAELADIESGASTDSSASDRIPDLKRQLKIEDDNLAFWLQQAVKSRPTQTPP